MLKFTIVLGGILLVSAVFSYSHGLRNVCPSLEDYKTIYTNEKCSYNPNVGSSTGDIVQRYGYQFENHLVVTEDGYILKLHRILPPSNKTSNTIGEEKRPPVIVFHGLGGSSAFWVLQGKKSLAFFLVDNGFDVWLGNFRGNYYSNTHVRLTQQSREYWNFGFHEIAIYDLPACIDFISKTTGGKGNLAYIGHSMGTTISYVYSILRAKHAKENLRVIVSLAPVAYPKNIRGLFKLLSPVAPVLADILRLKGMHAIGQFHELFQGLMAVTCGKYPLIISCNEILSLAAGQSHVSQFQPEILPVFLSYYPSGTSLHTLEHFAQLIVRGGQFQMFDYGPLINVQKYNHQIPPEYDVKQIQVPVHLFVGYYDAIGTQEDAAILFSKLQGAQIETEITKHLLPYAHNDFFLAKHLEPFHEKLLDIIKISKIGITFASGTHVFLSMRKQFYKYARE
ncbi:gastric triacylglycerol lipase-like isoform X2 [Euwallacea fornicatus]|uniref:gastric triacylglycerol lipase-like isoform X2 n=1 Tax=Euwallacea fornicatus TaxID=995702 RepID=UPI00338F0EF7